MSRFAVEDPEELVWENPKKSPRILPSDVANIFCPTGKGGGINPTCSPKTQGPSPLKVGAFEINQPGSKQGVARLNAAYQQASPADRAKILEHLGIPHGGSDGKGGVPSPTEFNQLATTLASRNVNPKPIQQVIKDGPHEQLRQNVEALAAKGADLLKRHDELGEQVKGLAVREQQARSVGNKSEADRLRAEADGLSRERYQLKKQADAVNGEAHTVIKAHVAEQAARNGLEMVKVDKGHFPDVKGGSPALAGEVAKARAFLDGSVATAPGRTVPAVTTGVSGDGRSAHKNGHLELARSSEARSAVHEYGHHLEYKLPGAREAAQEFLAYRVKGEAPTNLGEKYPDQFKRDEQGRKDDFDKTYEGAHAYYVGKTYPGGSTEVISMGIEKMYREPVAFAKQDPEFFSFVVGVMAGDVRRKPLPATEPQAVANEGWNGNEVQMY